MAPYFQSSVLVALLCHRISALTLPVFQEAVSLYGTHIAVAGLTSDLSLAFFILAFFELNQVPTSVWGRRLAAGVTGLVGLVLVLGLACHVKYMEYFGFTARPDHLVLLRLGVSWVVAGFFILESARSLSCLGFSLVLPWLVRQWCGVGGIRPLSRQRRWARTTGFCVVGAAFHFASLYQHLWTEVPTELRYNIFLAAHLKQKEKTHKMVLPTEEERLSLRRFLDPQREWVFADGRLPLWQSRVPSGDALSPVHEDTRSRLKQFLSEQASVHGPWNVMVVIEESLRAEEMESFGEVSADLKGLMPRMSENFQKDGIRFTETLSVGAMTNIGLLTSLCSLVVPDLSILDEYPDTNMVCLSDIFADKRYETYFICGYPEIWGNISQFFTLHKTQKMITEENYPSTAKRGVYGISDDEVFQMALNQLEKAKKPFFATVETQSFHMPFRPPEDMPDFVDRKLPAREQLRQYVDWSWGRLYEGIRTRFPHTIVVLVADHGMHYEGEPMVVPEKYHLVRKVHRIPMAIVIPGMPADIGGTRIQTLTSNADLAPTLLSLLGWLDTPQSFMGFDAFSRREPVFTPAGRALPNQQRPEAQLASADSILNPGLIVSTIKFDLLGPTPANRPLLERQVVRRLGLPKAILPPIAH